MMQNIYKQTKIKNCKISKNIKVQNIYKQAKKIKLQNKKTKIKLSKVQGFMFVSKTIYNKPCTTNQKPKNKTKKEENK
jgi:hypothetical protein